MVDSKLSGNAAFSVANGRMLLQVSAGWKHGDIVDEHTKSHPLLKPYKALTEKVLRKDFFSYFQLRGFRPGQVCVYVCV